MAILSALACGGADKPPATAATPVPDQAPPVTRPEAPMTATRAPGEWDCGGNLVPPNGWQQETAFHDQADRNARQAAWDEASAKLRERLCGHEGGCDFLQSRIKNWKTGSSGKDVCSMAVIASEDLEAWRTVAVSLRRLDDALAAAAKDILGPRPTGTVVAVDVIRDQGAPGGVRAEWLKARMERQLQSLAMLGSIPTGWAGNGAPAGIDVVIMATVSERTENQIPIVETLWKATRADKRWRWSEAVTFPQAAAPPFVGAAIVPTTDSEGLSLRIDSARAGSLCFGERTNLSVWSADTRHLRVINLYGDSDALMTFPNEDVTNDIVAGGSTIQLGGKLGFEAVPVPGPEHEEFIVIGATSEDKLGQFRGVKGTCRIPRALARQLHHHGGLPPGVKQARTGYRLVTGGRCPAASAQKREGVAVAISSLPECRIP